jgi:hypothetical protein
MAAAPDRDFWITTVNIYEMLGGAFRLIHDLKKKRKDPIPGFLLLQDLFDYLETWQGRSFRMTTHPIGYTVGSLPAFDKS